MGIFHKGKGTVNITGQAIGGDSGDSARARLSAREAKRRAPEAEADTGVRNTGGGSVNITDSVIDGRHVRNTTL